MSKRVLIVDDDASIRDSLKKVLAGAGYEVVLAASGLEAGFRFNPAPIDLVLLDLGLPEESGWEVYHRLTTHYPCVPVIIITGLPNQSRTALAAGAGALFEKPVEAPALLKRIEELLSESTSLQGQRLLRQVNQSRYAPAASVPPSGGHAMAARGN
jgi:two-component system, OmpR family, response regulator